MVERDNEQWVGDLSQPGPQRDAALDDLRALLVRGLGYALAKYGNVREADMEDFAQDALLKVLDGLDSFRGDSRFTTWAQKIAVHVAFTELRRRRWRDVSLDGLPGVSDGDFLPKSWVDPSASAEQQTIQREILETMRQVIAEELTERQRRALVAVRIHGMPLAEVARQMGTNRNALYKLLHDARQRLKERMLDKGLPLQDVLAAFGS
ncbi:MAG: sigma-70 family RNA polymerase sigma factor [Anaerolineae bacterium]|nr:sigma-70 family RNA polymerase sigma factor [Anaerolineae bacterium]